MSKELKEAAQQALDALENIAIANAVEMAMGYHEAMAGHRPERHAQLDAEVETVKMAATSLRAALAQPDDHPSFENMLGSLLARIHGDGGHYIDEHGWEKAFLDADAKVVQWLAQPDERDDLTIAYMSGLHDGKKASQPDDKVQQVLEAIAEAHDESLDENHFECRQILMAQIKSLRAALAQPEQGAELSDYPPLPEPDGYIALTEAGSVVVPPREFKKHNAYAVFTAEQVRQAQRDAIAADRAARGGAA